MQTSGGEGNVQTLWKESRWHRAGIGVNEDSLESKVGEKQVILFSLL